MRDQEVDAENKSSQSPPSPKRAKKSKDANVKRSKDDTAKKTKAKAAGAKPAAAQEDPVVTKLTRICRQAGIMNPNVFKKGVDRIEALTALLDKHGLSRNSSAICLLKEPRIQFCRGSICMAALAAAVFWIAIRIECRCSAAALAPVSACDLEHTHRGADMQVRQRLTKSSSE